jgi:trk system potassium uptake protein TrkH
MRSILSVLNFLGSLLLLFALYFVPPIATAVAYGEHALVGFLAGAGVSGRWGCCCVQRPGYCGTSPPRDATCWSRRSGTLIAAVATIRAALGLPGLSFTDAFFETMSGVSTTGATVLAGLDSLPHSVMLWRQSLSWLGGMGVIVLAVAVLPLLGIGGMQIHRAETPGGIKHFTLAPRIAETARLLWFVYAALTAACFAALWGAGMTPFDALCHALSTLALGGFSTHDANIAFRFAADRVGAGRVHAAGGDELHHALPRSAPWRPEAVCPRSGSALAAGLDRRQLRRRGAARVAERRLPDLPHDAAARRLQRGFLRDRWRLRRRRL